MQITMTTITWDKKENTLEHRTQSSKTSSLVNAIP